MLLEEARRVLVVVAHCDDAEWMFGGTVARLVDGGAEVSYVITTDGANGGVDLSAPAAELAAVRATEQRSAAEVLGVSEVVFLGYRDDELTVTVRLKRDLVRQIRRLKPDLVLTWMPSRTPGAPMDWCHGDHLATGEATLQAVYPEALMPRIHPQLAEEGLTTACGERGLGARGDRCRSVHRRHRGGATEDGRDLVHVEPERRGRR